jgi:hypothetical protein
MTVKRTFSRFTTSKYVRRVGSLPLRSCVILSQVMKLRDLQGSGVVTGVSGEPSHSAARLPALLLRMSRSGRPMLLVGVESGKS